MVSRSTARDEDIRRCKRRESKKKRRNRRIRLAMQWPSVVRRPWSVAKSVRFLRLTTDHGRRTNEDVAFPPSSFLLQSWARRHVDRYRATRTAIRASARIAIETQPSGSQLA